MEEKENNFEKEIENGFLTNMFCDNFGFCKGASCKNYYKCFLEKEV